MLDSDVDGNGNANDNGDMNIGGAGNEYVGGDAYADAIMEVKEGDETTTTGDGDKDGDADCDADGDGDEMVMDTERGVRNGLLRGSTSATAGTTGGDGLGVTTSSQNGASVGTQVMAWEDPFRDSNNVSSMFMCLVLIFFVLYCVLCIAFIIIIIIMLKNVFLTITISRFHSNP